MRQTKENGIDEVNTITTVGIGFKRLYYGFFIEATGGILIAIQNGNEQGIRKLLQSGLSANYCDPYKKRFLLEHAIDTGQVGISALLLLYGANPNQVRIIGHHKKRVAANLFVSQSYNESLAKLLLTYHADYSDQDTKSNINRAFHDIWPQRSERYPLYEREQSGQQLFKKRDFKKAQEAYFEAILLLEKFLEEEQEKLRYQEMHEVDKAKKTHSNILACYQHRLDQCKEQVTLCQKHLSQGAGLLSEKPPSVFTRHELMKPLLASEGYSSGPGLRRRHTEGGQ